MPRRGRPTRPGRRRALVVAALLLVPLALAGCGGDEGGTPTLTWYINPDNGGQKTLAAQCSEASGGAYRITTQVLPNDATSQREQLIRRLAAGDSSVDLMSLDPVFVAEFANAGYLTTITDEADVAQLTADVLPAALEAGIQVVNYGNARRVEEARLSQGAGGLSGPEIFPATLDHVRRTRQRFGGALDIVGTGGVDAPDKALALLDAGATAVGYFTGFITRGPLLARRICEHLLARRGG